ncbi:hypothetical protein INS49_015709 [Diaporthe citri]|uniref:uncharacterized protein n=1 Tax=Diaporthe citri TaxID=83186 RepID=UPI001C8172FE|nr:uncharacterized protein INS49_015709 [Diaporthe citri]KAG6356321.1 hypothetical protein INS49_015709 [Diaporthe citri]
MERLEAAISDLANLDSVQVDEPGDDSGYTTPTPLWVYHLERAEMSTAAEQKEKFFTVSYRWGTMSESHLKAFCQAAGKTLGGMTGWVDQLCINQKCAEEKGQEIKRMTNYYASASLNPVLLQGVEGAPRLRCLYQEIGPRTASLLSEAEKREVGGLVTMVGKDDYFTRVWTFQEQKLGRESLFMMADGMVPGMELVWNWSR